MVFDKQWFQKHNNTLCWFANAPVIKYWFRWLLRIHNDVSWDTKINQITPNSFTYNGKIVGDEIELTTDFRTHEKFGKRLYYGLKPLWYLLHFWDWSTSIQPALNCGFDTLTAYPDASIGATTVDSWVYYSIASATLATIRAGAGTSSSPTDPNLQVKLRASTTSNQFNQLMRTIMTFDTSALTGSASISSSVLSLLGVSSSIGLGSPDMHIAGATPADNNNVVAGDYAQCQTTSFGSIAYASLSFSAYNDFTLNASGIANVSKTGISRFSGQSSWDINNNFTGTWSSGLDSRLSFLSADTEATTSDPKLVVTYTTVVGPANVKTYKGLAAASVKTLKGLAIASCKSKKGLA